MSSLGQVMSFILTYLVEVFANKMGDGINAILNSLEERQNNRL